jgi:hypothetical protein
MQDLNGGISLQLAKERIQDFHAEAARQSLAHPKKFETAAVEPPETSARRSFGFAAWRSARVHVAEH